MDSKTVEVDDEGLPLKFKPVDESHLDRNEYLANKEDKPQFLPFLPDEDSSEETEEEMDWYKPQVHEKESYFAFVNMRRRTLQPGEQAYYCYGNRSNKFLLLNYGFCF